MKRLKVTFVLAVRATQRVTNSSTHETDPDIAANGANVYVAWQKHISAEGGKEIFLKYSPL